MLVPKKVEEVVVTVPITVIDKAVAALAEEGFFHVDEPPSDIKGGRVSRRYRSFYARVNEKLSRLDSYYRALKLEPSQVGGLELRAGGWEEAFEKIKSEYSGVESAFEKGVQRLTMIESKIKEYEAIKVILELISHVEADVREATRAGFLGYAIGYVTGEGVKQFVEKEATEHKVLVAIEQPSEDILVLAVAGSPHSLHKFLSSMRSFKWTPISIPEELPGSPRDAYETIVREIGRLQEEADSIIRELKSMKEDLDAYHTYIYALREVAKLLANTIFTRTVAVFRGFVDKSDSKKLRRLLGEALAGAYLTLSLGVKRAAQSVPTKVDLPRFLKPFHTIVRMYGEPDADEVVPTVFLAVTFPLIFGLMFPDMGHGLLVLLFTLWYFRGKESPWKFILSLLGAVSIVTGFLSGEFFGTMVAGKVGLLKFWESLGFETPPLAQATYAVEEQLSGEVVRSLIFNTMSIALWLAAFMLSLGSLLGFIDALLKGDKVSAFTGKLPVFLFFASATLPFLITGDAEKAGHILNQAIFGKGSGGVIPAVAFYGAVAGILWKLLGEPIGYALEGESIVHGLSEAFMGVYEMILMALGNIPSFLRIMGLGLAHSGLMLGFTELYHAIAGTSLLPAAVAVLLGGIVYAFGNILVAGLEAIIAFAHSLRLHFYEYFSKFYSGTGTTFTPIRIPGVEFIITG